VSAVTVWCGADTEPRRGGVAGGQQGGEHRLRVVERIELGTGGLVVPRVVLGTMAYGRHAADDGARIRTIHAAIDRGVTAIDTAPLYELGRAEILLGRAIADRRARVQVLTKAGLRWDDDHGDVLLDAVIDGRRTVVRRDSRPASLRRDVEGSLQRLGVEQIDLLQIHHPDPRVPIADAIGALVELHHEGKLGAIGVSNFSVAQLAEAHAAAGVVGIASHQLPLSLLQQRASGQLLAHARALGYGTLCYSPLAHGVLAGRGLGTALDAADDRRWLAAFSPDSLAAIGHVVRRIVVPIAARHDATIAQVALAWVLAQPGAGAVVVGASDVRQIDASLGALTIELAPAERERMRDAFAAIVCTPAGRASFAMRARAKAGRVVARLRGG
jgi:aryl-alcohol dehydrogenase-like predicted oxidoreductase